MDFIYIDEIFRGVRYLAMDPFNPVPSLVRIALGLLGLGPRGFAGTVKLTALLAIHKVRR